MLLGDYMKANNLSVEALACTIGVHQATVYRWLAGEQSPRKEQMTAIYELTGGAVSANDFMTLPVLQPERQLSPDAG